MKRSLGRRLVGALLFAFGLITLLIITLNYWDARNQFTKHSNAQQIGNLLARSLEGVSDEPNARAVVKGFAAELQRERDESHFDWGEVGFELRHADQRLVLALGPQLDRPQPFGWNLLQWKGRPHDVFRAQGGPWSVQVLHPRPSDAELLTWVLSEVGFYLLIALPVLLLTLWLAVRTGLAPLRHFVARMSALDTRHGLAPLELDLRYAELRPLGAAFNALLGRLRDQLARERALVHDAAHELRTPLAALGAQAHVLLNSVDPGGREEAAQALQQGLARTAHLSQQLLDLAHLDQDRPHDTERLDLAELSAGLLHQIHPQARARGVQMALQGPETLPWHGERLALHTLLQNLLDNAIRYGAREVELQIGQAPDGRPWLSVADDGPGIPTEHHQRMFERFWRGVQSQAGQERGTGLGLAIVAQALQRLGGRLEIGPGLRGRGIGFRVAL